MLILGYSYFNTHNHDSQIRNCDFKLVILSLQTRNYDSKLYFQTRNYDFQTHNRRVHLILIGRGSRGCAREWPITGRQKRVIAMCSPTTC